MIPVGFSLQPDEEFLDLLDALIRFHVDYYLVMPESLWQEHPGRAGGLGPNNFHRRFLELGMHTGKPFTAHGIALSLGTIAEADKPRRSRCLGQLRQDQRQFGFRWYTEHLGATTLAGLAMCVPVPVPLTDNTTAIVRGRIRQMQRVIPDVAVANNCAYFTLGDPLEEPDFLNRLLLGRHDHITLDLHNLYTSGKNCGYDPMEYLMRLDLSKVIEIRISGGTNSDARWVPSGRPLRLDTRDGPVPDAVWRLLEAIAPRCPSCRGVTLERRAGTVGPADVAPLAGELDQARRIVERAA